MGTLGRELELGLVTIEEVLIVYCQAQTILVWSSLQDKEVFLEFLFKNGFFLL